MYSFNCLQKLKHLISSQFCFLPDFGVAVVVVVVAAVVECDVCDDDGDGDVVEDALDLHSVQSSETRCCCSPGVIPPTC
jgi:hypothetical protein